MVKTGETLPYICIKFDPLEIEWSWKTAVATWISMNFTPKKQPSSCLKNKMVRFPMFFQVSSCVFLSLDFHLCRWKPTPGVFAHESTLNSFADHGTGKDGEILAATKTCHGGKSFFLKIPLGAEENMGRCRNQCIVMYIDDVYMINTWYYAYTVHIN